MVELHIWLIVQEILWFIKMNKRANKPNGVFEKIKAKNLNFAEIDVENSTKLVSISNIPTSQWYLILEMDKKTAFEPIYSDLSTVDDGQRPGPSGPALRQHLRVLRRQPSGIGEIGDETPGAGSSRSSQRSASCHRQRARGVAAELVDDKPFTTRRPDRARRRCRRPGP